MVITTSLTCSEMTMFKTTELRKKRNASYYVSILVLPSRASMFGK